MIVFLIVWLISVENLGFSSYPPAYFSSEAQGENLLCGANFASGASGYWDKTAILYVRIYYIISSIIHLPIFVVTILTFWNNKIIKVSTSIQTKFTIFFFFCNVLIYVICNKDCSEIDSFFIQGAVPLTRQLRNYEEYQVRIKAIAGEENATELIRESIYLLSAGSSDYVQNYYINPLINILKTPDQFADLLLQSFDSFVKV